MNASTRHATAVELINRYPDVTQAERELLVTVFPQLSNVEIALMLSDEDLAPKLEAFRDDHASKLRTPFSQYAVLAVIAVVGFLAALWSVALTK